MRKSTWIIIGILALGLVVALALINLRPEPARKPPSVQSPLVQTVPADVREGALMVSGSGTVRPRAQVSLAPQVSGRVVYVNPALVSGGRVRRGQVLVEIEKSDYENALKQAQAEVAQQQVGVLQAEEEASIALAEYERFLGRQQTRERMGALASIDTNDYAARLKPENGSNGTETDEPDNQPSSLVLREPQREAAKAALARAEAMLEDARLALSRTRIVAPFDGYIRSESIDQGQFVTTGQPLAEIYAADEVEVTVPLSTDEAALIPQLWNKRPDQNKIRIPAQVFMEYGGQSFRWEGYVHRAEAALDASSRTIDVVVRVPNPFSGGVAEDVPGEVNILSPQVPPLMVGQYTLVNIEGVQLQQYAAVPRQALRVGNEVWTVEQDSLLHIVSVQVLQKAGENVFVLGEIDESSSIIVSDLSVATEGMRIRRSYQDAP